MKKYWIASMVLFGAIQLIPYRAQSQPEDSSLHIAASTDIPTPVKTILDKACMDCHSNTIERPWYGQIAPISWWVALHVNEGREYLNFSEWESYEKEAKMHVIEESIEEVEKNKMPIAPYKLTHPQANLTDGERQVLIQWFKAVKVGLTP